MASRQREWQQRMQGEGRCIICGTAAVVSCYCERHRIQRVRKMQASRTAYSPQTCGVCGGKGHNRRTCSRHMGSPEALNAVGSSGRSNPDASGEHNLPTIDREDV